jgi:hypothetical protein
MMTPAQRLAFLDESAAEELKWVRIASERKDWPDALQNYGQAAKHRFERALLGWRTGLLGSFRTKPTRYRVGSGCGQSATRVVMISGRTSAVLHISERARELLGDFRLQKATIVED